MMTPILRVQAATIDTEGMALGPRADFLTEWAAMNPDIAYADASIKVIRILQTLLQLISQDHEVVSRYEVGIALVLIEQHMALQIPYVPQDLTASPLNTKEIA